MNSESTSVAEPLEEFLRSKSKGGDDSGNYRRNLERCVEDFLEWLADDARSNGTFGDLDERTFRRYARELSGRDLAQGTIRTYYAHVSAYIGWCVREGLLEANYAQRNVAKEPLPENDGRRSGDQQAWTDEHRRLITRYVDRRAHEAADEKGFDAIREFRDRALVYVLCYSGVRGGEIFADPKDTRRNGLRWDDVSLEDRTMTVLAKKQDWSDRSLTKQAVGPMERYHELLEPATDEWPVFPTFHLPSLYETLRTGLRAEYDWSDDEIEGFVDDLTGQTDVFEALRDYELTPPSINTDGARRIMRRLCSEADLELEGKHDYLAPHGGRRGAGEVMVRQRGFTAAARLLDNSEEVVRTSYSHIEAKEMAKDAGDAFTEHDS
ncbi:tyrosine-type recombinase/integrase [Haloterrigena alkaliphila]|uniref:tyrosine-type recombinase/integrase n=1 Tax=Haloterrigena alkaliphila TaxID=2816475 RepID=UPI001CFFB65F|nr:phage integrase SAM-like domain-containing protein [Haloterrigena alkaliphila]UHQ95054.1 phage integrase SAM-like domain-containing protein [Haloterrigena alkaliphila]